MKVDSSGTHDSDRKSRSRSGPRWTGEVPSALERSREIVGRMAGRTPAIFLDYDGTLTPIVSDPANALLPEKTKEAVERLAHRFRVAIISGRDLADLQRLVAIKGIAYAGSHGFDIVGPDGLPENRVRWLQFLPSLGQAEARLRQLLEDIPGASVERKRFAIAVHYRLVSDSYTHKVQRVVDQVAAQDSNLRTTGGNKVFELRPNIDWDKGKALVFLLELLGLDSDTVVPFFIGDDITDEDAFRTIQEVGIGIIVLGREKRLTVAHYTLQNPVEVGLLRLQLADVGEGIADERVQAAQQALDEGDTSKADEIFAEVEAMEADSIERAANAAFQRGRIAEDEILDFRHFLQIPV